MGLGTPVSRTLLSEGAVIFPLVQFLAPGLGKRADCPQCVAGPPAFRASVGMACRWASLESFLVPVAQHRGDSHPCLPAASSLGREGLGISLAGRGHV